MRNHHILYTILFRPLPSIITNARKRNELQRAIERTRKPLKKKYAETVISKIKEWR